MDKNTRDQLRAEAKQLLSSLLKLPKDTESTAVSRLIDCVIMAAVLEVVDMTARSYLLDQITQETA